MADDRAILEADGLRVVFLKQSDRYVHFIEALDADGKWAAGLISMEGLPQHDWAPSPPFQQLHIEDRPTGRVILLVGMAGRTHWSAAVEADVASRGLAFDVAARLHDKPPVPLGSLYDFYNDGPKLCIRTPENVVASVPWRVRAPIATEFPVTVTWRYVITRCDRV